MLHRLLLHARSLKEIAAVASRTKSRPARRKDAEQFDLRSLDTTEKTG